MSDEYASDAIIRWEDDGQVNVMWEANGHIYGFSVAPEIFDEMLLPLDSFDEVRDHTPRPVVMQLLTWNNDAPGFDQLYDS